MKKYILFTLIGVLALSVSSCSSSDDDPTPQKLISKITTDANYGYEFTYDSQNRIQTYVLFDGSYRARYTIEYSNGYFTMTSDKGSTYKCTQNENGNVSKIEEDGDTQASFAYNTANQLETLTAGSYVYNVTWAQGNPISINLSGERQNYAYDSSLTNKANLDINWYHLGFYGHDYDLGILGFFGKTSNLMNQSGDGTIEYEFDSDGYVTKMIHNMETETETTYITYK